MAFVRLDAAWPAVRGGSALAQAVTAGAVSRMSVHAGHILAVGRNGTAVAAFDAVPATGWQIPEAAQTQLGAVLMGGPGDAGTLADPLKPLLIASGSAGARVVGVHFQASMNLRKPQTVASTTAGSGASAGGATASGSGAAFAGGQGSTATGGGSGVIAAPANAVPGPNAGFVPSPGIASAVRLPQAPPSSAAPPPDPSRGPFVWIVRENGTLELWRLLRRKYTWSLIVRVRLPSAPSSGGAERAAAIADVAFVPIDAAASETSMVLVFTEASSAASNRAATATVVDAWAQCVLVEATGNDQFQVQCSLPKPVLRAVALPTLVALENGVAFLPTASRLATPRGDADTEDVCYFWSPEGAVSSLWTAAQPANAPGLVTMSQPVLLSVVWGRSLTTGDTPTAASTSAVTTTGAPAADHGATTATTPTPMPPVALAPMVAYAVQPQTRELLVLDAAGLVTVCTLADGALQLRPLVTLTGNGSGAPMSPEDSAVRGFAYHRLHLVVATATGLRLHHLATGHVAERVAYPPALDGALPALWQVNSGAAQLGVWHPRIGILQLQMTAIGEALAHPPASHGSRSVADAAFAADKWGLDRVRAKHILDAALVLVHAPTPPAAAGIPPAPARAHAQPSSDAIRAALALLERELLETPALAVAVLNELPQHRATLGAYLVRFLQKYDGAYRSETSSPANEALRVRTPLGDQLRRTGDEGREGKGGRGGRRATGGRACEVSDLLVADVHLTRGGPAR